MCAVGAAVLSGGTDCHYKLSTSTSAAALFNSPLVLIVTVSVSLPPQRAGTRRRYHDDGISDEEIDGRRMFDLEEKVSSQRFNSDRVLRMEGKGRREGFRDRQYDLMEQCMMGNLKLVTHDLLFFFQT